MICGATWQRHTHTHNPACPLESRAALMDHVMDSQTETRALAGARALCSPVCSRQRQGYTYRGEYYIQNI